MSDLRLQPTLPIHIPAKAVKLAVPPVIGHPETKPATVSPRPTIAAPPKIRTELDQSRARLLQDTPLTGPPPSFQASLLEVESDIGYIIRQIEAAREKARNGSATTTARHADPIHSEQKPDGSTA